MKSNAVTSTKCAYLNATDRELAFGALGKTTLESTQSSSSPAQYSQHRHGLTLGISLFPARPMLKRSMLPWSFSIDNSLRALLKMFFSELSQQVLKILQLSSTFTGFIRLRLFV